MSDIIGPVLDAAGRARKRLETKYFVEAMANADARIAALEAQVAKLRAPVERSEAIRAWNAWMMVAHPEEGMTSVLNAFLEGRKG